MHRGPRNDLARRKGSFTLEVYAHLMTSAPDRMRAAIDKALTAQPVSAVQDQVSGTSWHQDQIAVLPRRRLAACEFRSGASGTPTSRQ